MRMEVVRPKRLQTHRTCREHPRSREKSSGLDYGFGPVTLLHATEHRLDKEYFAGGVEQRNLDVIRNKAAGILRLDYSWALEAQGDTAYS
jgi:hypothetical protein